MLLPRCKLELRSSGTLRSIDWQSVADVSAQPIGSMFKGQVVQEELNSEFVSLSAAIRHFTYSPFAVSKAR